MFVAKIGGKSSSRYIKDTEKGRKKLGPDEVICGKVDGKLLTHNLETIANEVGSRLDEQPVLVVSAINNTTDLLLDAARAAYDGGDWRTHYNEIEMLHHTVLDKAGMDTSFLDRSLDKLEHLLANPDALKLGRFGKQLSFLNKNIANLFGRDIIKDMYLDLIGSFGERMAAKMIAERLNMNKISAVALNTYDIRVITNSRFGDAAPLEGVEYRIKENVQKYIDKGIVPVITGFIGKNRFGYITTLGRGATDWIAAIVSEALGAHFIEFWKDVDGVKRADPDIIGSNVETVRKLSYRETQELAYKGARVLYPRSMEPLIRANIPARLLNIYNIGAGETWIDNYGEKEEDVKVIVCNEGHYKVTVHNPSMVDACGYAAKIFDIFAKYRQPVGVIGTSEAGISVTVKENGAVLEKVKKKLRKIGDVSVEESKAIISVVGEGMHNTSGIAGKVFGAVGNADINVEMISQGGSQVNISFVVDGKDAYDAVRAVYAGCFTGCPQNL